MGVDPQALRAAVPQLADWLGKVFLPPAGMAICLALITQFEAIVYGVTAGAVALGVGVWLLSRPPKGRHMGTHA